MIDNIRDLLIRHEGIKPYAYKDSLGFLTIGVGHLIDERRGGKLSLPTIYAILDEDIKSVQDSLPNWISPGNLGDVRYAVLVDMAFNLGVAGLLSFTRTLDLIKEGKYEEASIAMMESKWAKQVGPRAYRLRDMMRTGTWPAN